jgi:hypothetical protein
MSEGAFPLLDAIAAREAAEQGIAQAADNKKSLLEFAKKKAIELGREHWCVTADDVQLALVAAGIDQHALGNAAGSVFKDKTLWRYANRVVKSERVSSHGRLIRVWQYIGK